MQPSLSNILGSWKEIAVFLHRGVRTVQRWERDEGLPVHRHNHLKRGTIIAYPSEIERWMKERRAEHATALSIQSQPNLTPRIYAQVDHTHLMALCVAARSRAEHARHR